MSILKYNGQLVTLGNQYVGVILPVLPFLEFLTNASTNALTPVVGTTGGTVQWDMGDGSIVDSNDFSHIYSSPGEKTVKVFPGDLYGVVDSFFVNEDDLVGTFDWSDVPTIESLWVDSNPALTEIISPTTANDVFSFQGHNCDLTGTLDISGLSSSIGSLGGLCYLDLDSFMYRINIIRDYFHKNNMNRGLDC